MSDQPSEIKTDIVAVESWAQHYLAEPARTNVLRLVRLARAAHSAHLASGTNNVTSQQGELATALAYFSFGRTREPF